MDHSALYAEIEDEFGHDCSPLSLSDSVDYMALFESLVQSAGLLDNKKLAVASDTGASDDYYIRKYMYISPENTKHTEFIKCIEIYFPYKNIHEYIRKIGTDNRRATEKQFIVLICASAYYHDRNLKVHLAHFFQHCRISGISLNGTQGHKSTVSNLISEQLIKSSQRQYEPGVLSGTPFSGGLQALLENYNNELRFLTIGQVIALNEFQHHRRLWIQGEAGTGKTIFAVEAIYRRLRAGEKVLVVYRSKQFEQLFSYLLQDVADGLYLMVHLDFLYLLRQVELYGLKSSEFTETLASLLGLTPEDRDTTIFDTLVVDDCGTYEIQMIRLMKYVEGLANRKIFLAASDQILGNITLDVAPVGADRTKVNTIHNVYPQRLIAPSGYHVVTLKNNVRNAKAIAQYAHQVKGLQSDIGIGERGVATRHEANWKNLESTVLRLVEKALESFSPNQIKILVDPYLNHPYLSKIPDDEYHEVRDQWLESEPPIVKAILIAGQDGHFLHSTFECEEEDLAHILREYAEADTVFIYTDGEEVGTVKFQDIKPRTFKSLPSVFKAWGTSYVDATRILDENALVDPIQAINAICIYSTPLFIGLESDVIIYVRSLDDGLADMIDTLDNPVEVESRLINARNDHHFMAISRAKFVLHDVLIK